MKACKFLSSVALAGLSIFWATSFAANSALDTKQIESLIHNYIIKNPEVLVQSLQSYQQKQMEQTQKTFDKIQSLAPKHADSIFRQAGDPIAGNPKGTVTLVEFSDYQCTHCIAMTSVIENLIKKNPNLRVVVKEFPIRGPMSETAAKAALASVQQNKYFEFHHALMASKKEPLTEITIFEIAKSTGLDVDKLKKDMKSDAVTQAIKNNYKLAQELQLAFTPVFFIAKTNIDTNASPAAVVFIPGGVGEDQINDAINKIGA